MSPIVKAYKRLVTNVIILIMVHFQPINVKKILKRYLTLISMTKKIQSTRQILKKKKFN